MFYQFTFNCENCQKENEEFSLWFSKDGMIAVKTKCECGHTITYSVKWEDMCSICDLREITEKMKSKAGQKELKEELLNEKRRSA